MMHTATESDPIYHFISTTRMSKPPSQFSQCALKYLETLTSNNMYVHYTMFDRFILANVAITQNVSDFHRLLT